MRFLFFIPSILVLAFLAAPVFAQGFINPLGEVKTFPDLLKNIAKALIAVTLPLATMAFIITGFQFLINANNPQKLQQTKKQFFWILIGAAIVIGSSLLASVMIDFIRNTPSTGGFSSTNQGSIQQDYYRPPSAQRTSGVLPAPSSSEPSSEEKDATAEKLAREVLGIHALAAQPDTILRGEVRKTPEGVLLTQDGRKISAYDVSTGPGAKLLQEKCPQCLVVGGDISVEKAKELAQSILRMYHEKLRGDYGSMDGTILLPATQQAQDEIMRDFAEYALEMAVEDQIKRGKIPPELKNVTLEGLKKNELHKFTFLLDGASIAFDDKSIIWNGVAYKGSVEDSEETFMHELGHVRLFDKFGIKSAEPGIDWRDRFNEHPATKEWIRFYDESMKLRKNYNLAPEDAGFCSSYGSMTEMEDTAECLTVGIGKSGYYTRTDYGDEKRNQARRQGNELRYQRFQWLYKYGFIPELPPPPK